MQGKRVAGLVAAASAGVMLLSGCTQGADEPEVDASTAFAMDACGIEKVETSSSEGESSSESTTYTSFTRGNGDPWSITDPVGHEERAAKWKESAVAAEAAAQLDDKWADLADVSSYQHTFSERVVSVRASAVREGEPVTWDWWFEQWPRFNDDVNKYNQNLSITETTCSALVKTLETR